jgi:hypothetical protein
MSEYQRYEWVAIDRPLTRAQLEAVEKLSSHIEASSSHALIEYNWGTSSTIARVFLGGVPNLLTGNLDSLCLRSLY